MADKGFDVSYDLLIHGCRLNMPPFVKGGHMSKSNVVRTRKIASLRIHVEHAIGRVKQYHILTPSVSPLMLTVFGLFVVLLLYFTLL